MTYRTFTDGTLNNAGNIEVYRQRVKDECLMPRQQGAIDDDECERRLSLLLGDSYANAASNINKLWGLYREWEEETEAAKTVGLSIYTPGAGSKTGDPDSLLGMVR